MTTQTADLFLVEDLAEAAHTEGLGANDLAALQAVADWVTTYVVQPHPDLGRAGPVCPFVPGALERGKLWLASEHIADRTAVDLVDTMDSYRRRFLERQPADGDDAPHAAIMVVFPDLSADRAPALFAEALQQLAMHAYAEDGIVFGPFYDGHEGTAIYNSDFHPFRSPVPFIFVRHGVVDDWKFFLDDDDWFTLYARRFGEVAAHALGGRLRQLPWRAASG